MEYKKLAEAISNSLVTITREGIVAKCPRGVNTGLAITAPWWLVEKLDKSLKRPIKYMGLWNLLAREIYISTHL